MTDLQALADQLLAAAREGHHIQPGPYVHAQLVHEMFGGAAGWNAMTADLDTAHQEFQW